MLTNPVNSLRRQKILNFMTYEQFFGARDMQQPHNAGKPDCNSDGYKPFKVKLTGQMTG
jgi:hypothetical protein